MKKQLFGLFLVLSFVLNVSAQKAAVADKTEQNLRKNVAYLASDRLDGRRTGEAGATTAAGYITGLFAGFKLKPGFVVGKKASYLQPFPYVTGVEMAKTGNEFSLEVTPASGGRIKVENMLPVKPAGFSPNATVPATGVVFAGFGITSTEPKYDDYTVNGTTLDVKGKVVLVFDGNPDNDNPHSAFGRFDARTKTLIAKDKGAVGLLLVSREEKFEDDKLTQLKYDQTLGEAALPTFVVSRNTAENIIGIDKDALTFVEGMIAMRTDPGVKTTYPRRSTDPIVSFKVNLVKKKSSAYNVVGILPGTDPVLKNEAIVIGAHYDHLGRGGQGSLAANSTEIHHGADDNASGTSAIIELARQFSTEKKNKRTLIFIAFSGEEEGLLGSKYYVDNPVFPIEKTVAMINLDMVGRLDDDKLTIGGIGTASEWKGIVEKINSTNGNDGLPITTKEREMQKSIYQAYKMAGIDSVKVTISKNEITLSGPIPKEKLPKAMIIANEVKPRKITNNMNYLEGLKSPFMGDSFSLQLNEDGFGPSDHSSFYGKKVPVLFFFTGTHVDYHKPSDTADKINYEGLVKVGKYVAAIVKAIDQNAKKPTYTVAKSSGTGGGRMGFNISLGTIPNYADSTDGLLLDGVRDGSPAAKAGIKAGDKIVKLNGKDVRNASDYTFVLGTMKAGEEYEVIVMRCGERLVLKIVPVKR